MILLIPEHCLSVNFDQFYYGIIGLLFMQTYCQETPPKIKILLTFLVLLNVTNRTLINVKCVWKMNALRELPRIVLFLGFVIVMPI